MLEHCVGKVKVKGKVKGRKWRNIIEDMESGLFQGDVRGNQMMPTL